MDNEYEKLESFVSSSAAKILMLTLARSYGIPSYSRQERGMLHGEPCTMNVVYVPRSKIKEARRLGKDGLHTMAELFARESKRPFDSFLVSDEDRRWLKNYFSNPSFIS